MAVLPCLLAFGLLAGCSDSTTTEPEEKQTEPQHQMDANANDLVLEEIIGAASESSSSIWSAVERPGGGQYFRGYFQNHWVVGAIGSNHDLEWTRRTYYDTRSLQVVPENSTAPAGSFVVSGNKDVDDDGWYDTGVISVILPNGDLADQLEWTEPDVNVRFAGFLCENQGGGDLSLLVAGATSGDDAIYHPMLAAVTVQADGTLGRGELRRFPNVANVRFWQPRPNPSTATGGYVVSAGDYDVDADLLHSIVFGLDAGLAITWQTSLDTGVGLRNELDFGRSRAPMSDTIFCVGRSEVDRTSSSGRHWEAAAVFALSPSGGIRWSRVYDLSQWSDSFEDFRLEGDVLFVSGRCASYESDGHQYGYGWLGKIDGSTGDLISNLSFGDNACASGVNCLISAGPTSTGAGYTAWEADGGGYRHWIVSVEMSDRLPLDLATDELGFSSVRADCSPPSSADERAALRGAGNRMRP